MSEHQEAAGIAHESSTGKLRFRRKRNTSIKPVEEILVDGSWRTRTPQDKAFNGQVRFKLAGLYIAGKRVRRYFSTASEAQTFVEAQTVRQGNLGARAAHVDGRLVEDAVECEAMLKAHGIRLLDAVRDFLAARQQLRAFPSVPLAEAAHHYSALLTARVNSWTAREAAKHWLASREKNNCSTAYLVDAKRRLKDFKVTFGEISLADISTDDIDSWAGGLGLSAQSVRNYLTVISSMFSFAVKKGKSPRNPVQNVERPEVVRDEAGILSPQELRDLLKHLPNDTVPYVVLSAFAGLRPAEVRRIQWQDINFATGLVTVKSGTSKTKRRRTVPMTDNLKAWLRPLAKDEGPVVELADITIRQKRIKTARAKAKLAHWPHDCMRHSAASYWLETEADAARVALWLGHSQEVLHEHYKGLVRDPKDAAEWFSITPPPDRNMDKPVPFKAV